MSKTYLLTVGTSLVTNKDAKGFDDAALLARLAADPVAASAEANVLSRMEREPGDVCVFLHSQTDDGARCGRLLVAHFGGHTVEVTGLSYNEGAFSSRGLRSLVQLLCREVRAARKAGQDVVLLPQGGFKAETAYATIIGLLFGLPMFYVHETFKSLVPLPAAPISWDLGLFVDHEWFFAWLDEEPRPTREVEQRLAALGEDRAAVEALLEPDTDGNTYLSPMGDAYFEAFRGVVEGGVADTVLLSPAAKEALDRHRDVYAPVLERLARRQIRQARGRVRGEVLIFPQGRSDGRAAYVEKDGGPFVLELVRHGREYDDLNDRLRQGKLREEGYDFESARRWPEG